MYKEKLQISYDSLDENTRSSVLKMESMGHILYIRYLFTKKYSPTIIINELRKMGFSAPRRELLTLYFKVVMWTSIEKFGLQEEYSSYYSFISGTNKRWREDGNILLYKKFSKSKPELIDNFFKFISFLDIHPMWTNELKNFYGSPRSFPKDEDGTQFFDDNCLSYADPTNKNVEKIMQSPRRFEIDQMILEDVQPSQVLRYMKDELGIDVASYDLSLYKKTFFNIKAETIEEKIENLTREKNLLIESLAELNSKRKIDNYAVQTSSDNIAIQKITEDRIRGLEENIFLLNTKYTRIAAEIAANRQFDKNAILQDIMLKAYDKFRVLNYFNDRGVIKPLLDLTRIVVMTSDKLDNVETQEGTITGESENVMIDLLKQRVQDFTAEELSSISPEEISGIEELGATFKDDSDKVYDEEDSDE